MEPAGLGANELRDRGGEGDHVMADLGFDFANALQPEISELANGLGRLPGYDSGFGESLGGRNFNLQPGAETVLFAPDAANLGPCIA